MQIRPKSTLCTKSMEIHLFFRNSLMTSWKVNKFRSEQKCVHRIFFRRWDRWFWVGNDSRSPEKSKSVFNQFPIILDYLGRIYKVLEECITDGRTDGRTDGQTDGPTDQRTDKASYRDARTHLKIWTRLCAKNTFFPVWNKISDINLFVIICPFDKKNDENKFMARSRGAERHERLNQLKCVNQCVN